MTTLLRYAQGCDNLVTTLLCDNMFDATLGFLYRVYPSGAECIYVLFSGVLRHYYDANDIYATRKDYGMVDPRNLLTVAM